MKFKKGDKVVVFGLDLAFVVQFYIDETNVKLLIEGESMEDRHYVISAREEVLRLNDDGANHELKHYH